VGLLGLIWRNSMQSRNQQFWHLQTCFRADLCSSFCIHCFH
jgi:hypothetical protein